MRLFTRSSTDLLQEPICCQHLQLHRHYSDRSYNRTDTTKASSVFLFSVPRWRKDSAETSAYVKMKRYSASIASIAKGFTDVSYPKMNIKLKGADGYTLLSDFAHYGSGHYIKNRVIRLSQNFIKVKMDLRIIDRNRFRLLMQQHRFCSRQVKNGRSIPCTFHVFQTKK